MTTQNENEIDIKDSKYLQKIYASAPFLGSPMAARVVQALIESIRKIPGYPNIGGNENATDNVKETPEQPTGEFTYDAAGQVLRVGDFVAFSRYNQAPQLFGKVATISDSGLSVEIDTLLPEHSNDKPGIRTDWVKTRTSVVKINSLSARKDIIAEPKDSAGAPLKKGDTVVWSRYNDSEIYKGTVDGFSKTGESVIVKYWGKRWIWSHDDQQQKLTETWCYTTRKADRVLAL